MTSFKKSCIFVCTKKKGCGACGADRLVKNLKKEIKEQGMKSEYKVMSCSCLGLCKQGVATVTYPENRLITKLGPKDAAFLLKRIEKNRLKRRARSISCPIKNYLKL